MKNNIINNLLLLLLLMATMSFASCKDDEVVNSINKFCPDENHPHAIDLGLPSGMLWACCNVGANKPEAYGSYYAWGETEEKDTYDWSSYAHCDGSQITCHDLGNDIRGTQYDMAQILWGSNWLLPTQEHIEELLNNCTHEWTMLNGVKGVKFTSKTNGSSIFLPAAGKRYDSVLGETGVKGNYWTSTQDNSSNAFAYCLCFDAVLTYCSDLPRNNGVSIRPVIASLQISSTELSLIVGEKGTVEINSGSGNYIEQSSDANVATATLSGDTVTVTAVGEGIATITVTDRISRQTAAIEVTVQPNPFRCPDKNHPHMIDLGLPSGTLWACCNVGASSPEAYGGYFAWGETEEKDTYDWSNYSSYYHSSTDLLEMRFDVARNWWGGSWMMPVQENIEELLNNCTHEWTMMNGVTGVKFTSKTNDRFIFLPAAGKRHDSVPDETGVEGNYWACTPDSANASYAKCLSFDADLTCLSNQPRYYGISIRPVIATCESLQIYPSELCIMVGKQGTVKINSGSGYYYVKTYRGDKVTATVSGDTVTVTAVNPGRESILVTDRISRQTAEIKVTVRPIFYTSCPDDNHPHWIDLGLSRLWRCCNEGASKPEEYGNYDNLYQAKSVPNKGEMLELLNNTTSVWTTLNGVNGRRFTGKNGGTIFLPAAGNRSRYDDVLHNVGTDGFYWTCIIDDYMNELGVYYHFNSNKVEYSVWGDCYNKYSVRAVY